MMQVTYVFFALLACSLGTYTCASILPFPMTISRHCIWKIVSNYLESTDGGSDWNLSSGFGGMTDDGKNQTNDWQSEIDEIKESINTLKTSDLYMKQLLVKMSTSQHEFLNTVTNQLVKRDNDLKAVLQNIGGNQSRTPLAVYCLHLLTLVMLIFVIIWVWKLKDIGEIESSIPLFLPLGERENIASRSVPQTESKLESIHWDRPAKDEVDEHLQGLAQSIQENETIDPDLKTAVTPEFLGKLSDFLCASWPLPSAVKDVTPKELLSWALDDCINKAYNEDSEEERPKRQYNLSVGLVMDGDRVHSNVSKKAAPNESLPEIINSEE